MHWIIQNNLWAEKAYDDMLVAFKRMNVEHTQIKIIPFTDQFVAMEFDHLNHEWEQAEEPDIDETLPLFPYGSVALTRIAIKRKWRPGALLNENFDFTRWRDNLGPDNLLNGSSIACTIRESLEHTDLPDHLFVRPQFDNKAFTGKIESQDQYMEWARQIAEIKYDPDCRNASLLHQNTPVAIAPQRKILAEYRLFVVDGEIVTGSLYKLGMRVIYDSDYLNSDVIQYAETMIKKWQPAKAFVIDIAETPVGCKVIEYNNINCSGLYASDVYKLIDAVEHSSLVDL